MLLKIFEAIFGLFSEDKETRKHSLIVVGSAVVLILLVYFIFFHGYTPEETSYCDSLNRLYYYARIRGNAALMLERYEDIKSAGCTFTGK